MRKTIITVCFLIVGSWVVSLGENKDNGFYEHQGAGKTIAKLQRIILSGEADFTYGFQSYNQSKITESACFYNQPSNTLHYVLMNEKGHTLHFLIPILNLDHVNSVVDQETDKSFIELVYHDQLGMKVKEHNDRSRIIFSLQFTSFQMPVDQSNNTKDLLKQFNKLIKKASKYQGN